MQALIDAAADDLYTFESPPMLVVLSGPSGVGKDTLLNCLKRRGRDFAFVVTMTTRPRRPNEVEGVDYLFVSHQEFERLIRADEFLEHSVVYGDLKGIPKSQVRRALATGMDVVMRIDVQGAEKIRAIVPNVVTIFIAPDTEEELVTRLRERNTEDDEKLRRRLSTAREEMRRRDEFDYVVVNRGGCQDEAADNIVSIIAAEHCRVGRQAPRI
jgi:guanylate kinase